MEATNTPTPRVIELNSPVALNEGHVRMIITVSNPLTPETVNRVHSQLPIEKAEAFVLELQEAERDGKAVFEDDASFTFDNGTNSVNYLFP